MARASTRSKKALYSVHPSVLMVQKWIAELPHKTGKSLDEWIELIRKQGPTGTDERGQWLKDEHGFGTNTAWWLAEQAAGKAGTLGDGDPKAYLRNAEGYVDALFTGNKAALRPIYEALLDLCLNLAPDVKACPCQTVVPIFRNHVIAQIKPSTRTRLDFGLALKDTKGPARLIDTGGFARKDRITHRIPISSLDEVDADVKKWLKKAYDMDA